MSRSDRGARARRAPSAGGGGENFATVRNISGHGKVLSLRPYGPPPSQREARRSQPANRDTRSAGFLLFGAQWAHKAWAVAFLIFFVLACCGIACKTCRCKKLGGFAMLASATVWGCISAGFVASYPPLNTGVLIYALMSLMCWFTGEHLMYTARSVACTDCSEGGNECGAP